MRNLLLYVLAIFLTLGFQGNKPHLVKWVITNGCSLKVDGSTNVNNFSCVIANYSKPDTILVSRNSNSSVQLSGSIQLDVQNFNCHNPVMTADLRKTLKVKEYPKMTIRFISLSRYPDAATRHEITRGMVMIDLAGVSKNFEVDYKVVAAENAYINLVGSRKVTFSDFNISPPRKLGGMIKTKDELSVVFDLKMKIVK